MARNAKFSIIEQVYAGGFFYRANLCVNELFRNQYFLGIPMKKLASKSKTVRNFSSFRIRALNDLLFGVCEELFGAKGRDWRVRQADATIQFYFKTLGHLKVFVERFGSCIKEVNYPDSSAVLAVLNTRTAEERPVYRKSLFWHKYRWCVTLHRGDYQNNPDFDQFRDWADECMDDFNLTDSDGGTKIYFNGNGDINLLRFGFNHLIKKIEKVILHGEISTNAPQLAA